ncbi:MAG TPA: fimbrillin family protein [Rikenellaceae bacterium]|nr:fimbrillin family protein [Rikenellaceae bacterium]
MCLSVVCAAIAVCGCNKETVKVESQPKYITVTTSIGDMTRVTTNENGSQEFSNGDELSIYAWTGSSATAPAAKERVVDNAINKLGADGKWTSNPQMLWKNMKDNHFFIGVYPKNGTSVADLASADYTLDVTKQDQSDLLIATEFSGKVANNNPVSLTFDHVMAKVVVELSFRNQWGGGDPTVENVVLKNVSNSAKVNYLTKTVTPGSSREAELVLYVVTANKKYNSIIIPQDGINTVVVKIGGKDFVYTHNVNGASKNFTFESGKFTTIKLIVGRNQIDLGDVTINDWKGGSVIEGGEAYD